MRLLDSGFLYIHGRDKNFRPLIVLNTRVFADLQPEDEDTMASTHFVLQYMETYMTLEEKIENWVPIIDLDGMGFKDIPINRLLKFMEHNKLVYKCRSYKNFILNATFGIRLAYSMVSQFLPEKIKQKVVFSSTAVCKDITKLFHPTQLQKKYGGEAENVTKFWPPYEASQEYGADLANFERAKSKKDIQNVANSEGSGSMQSLSTTSCGQQKLNKNVEIEEPISSSESRVLKNKKSKKPES
mmetsp:Transcript_19495/g.22687  ORF Transcript_19495/g.22687 Transcript_19495/m.22687 type:complete len:242 (+) Transcript_19495:420-1145(+)